MDAVHISVLCCVVITATNSNCGSPLAIIMPFILQHPCNDPPLWPLGFDSFLTAFVLCGVTSCQPYKGLTTHFGPSFQSAFSYPVVETFQWLTVFMAFDFRKINKLATFLFHNGFLVAKISTADHNPPVLNNSCNFETNGTLPLQFWVLHIFSLSRAIPESRHLTSNTSRMPPLNGCVSLFESVRLIPTK